ncbi:MAG: VCBS repeat-containing protein [Candidatus Hydrogenedentota bacterium]
MADKPRCAFMLLLFLTSCVSVAATAQGFRQHNVWFPVGPNPSAIASTDLNGNGIPEIIAADTGELTDPRSERPANNELSVLAATKPLEYEKQVPLITGFGPYCIAIANIDALPALDILVGSFHAVERRSASRDLTLFRNIGDLLFEPVEFSVPVDRLRYLRNRDADEQPIFTKPGITAMTVYDFNADDYRDVIATGWSSDVLIYFPGHPTAYFEEPRFLRAPGGPRDIQTADFDNDGNMDLVTVMYASGEIVLWKGDGEGNFEEADRFLSRGALPHKVRVADINADGKPDLVVSHCHTYDSIAIYYGTGDFKFELCQEISLGTTRSVLEHEIRDFVVEDLNEDGRPDIALACFASARVSVLMNTSEDNGLPQTFSKSTYTFESGGKTGKPRALCVQDFDGDEVKDLAVALWNANAVALLLGR